MKKLSAGEELLAVQIRALKLPDPVREYRFCDRMWRFDFAWPDERYGLAVEVDGGNTLATIGANGKAFSVGRHTMRSDYEKINTAVLLGWRVLKFTPDMVKSGEATSAIERVLA